MLKLITARFAGKCAETGRPLKVGDQILYDSESRKAYHRHSDKALQFAPLDETTILASETEALNNWWISKK
jgi:hypothetical protein